MGSHYPSTQVRSPGPWFFLLKELAESSTHREVRGLLYNLLSFAAERHGRAVIAQVDNKHVYRVAAHGSTRAGLNTLAQQLFLWCQKEALTLSIRWVPRELNRVADAISKLVDSDDWRLNPRYFNIMSQLWGPFTLDAFASDLNT